MSLSSLFLFVSAKQTNGDDVAAIFVFSFVLCGEGRVCLWLHTHTKHTHQSMGRTELHEAAERGESERLQALLDSGRYDVNGRNDLGVCK